MVANSYILIYYRVECSAILWIIRQFGSLARVRIYKASCYRDYSLLSSRECSVNLTGRSISLRVLENYKLAVQIHLQDRSTRSTFFLPRSLLLSRSRYCGLLVTASTSFFLLRQSDIRFPSFFAPLLSPTGQKRAIFSKVLFSRLSTFISYTIFFSNCIILRHFV